MSEKVGFAPLLDIEDCLKQIVSVMENLSEIDFTNNRLYVSAMIREFEVIGEATKRLSFEFREQHPHLPWRQLAGMRDKLIHDYSNVDKEILWFSAKYEAVELLISVEKIIQDLNSAQV